MTNDKLDHALMDLIDPGDEIFFEGRTDPVLMQEFVAAYKALRVVISTQALDKFREAYTASQLAERTLIEYRP